MSKKTIKIVLIILAILFVIFIIDLSRKTYIISKFNSHCKELSNETNFYKKMNDNENAIVEFWRKDNLGIYKRTSSDGVRMIYYGEENDYMIIDTIDSEGVENKQAVRLKKESNVLDIPKLGTSSIYTEDIFQTMILAFACRITTEDVNGTECYKIYIDNDFQIFVNKDNYSKVREINGSTDTGIIEYTLNEVTDEDIKLPDLEGYKTIEAE